MYNAAVGDFERFARFYDLDHGDFREDIALYCGLADRTGSPILEVGCGTGRLLLPLAGHGFVVTGVDVSPAMLAIAREKVAAADFGEQVTLVQADAREFRLSDRFALAISAINSFMLFVDLDDQLRVLRSVSAHLRPGGLLVLDLFNPDLALLSEDAGRVVHEYTRCIQPGASVTKCSATTVELGAQRVEVTSIYDEQAEDGTIRRTVASFSSHYFWRRELELLLDKAGFRVEHIYGSYDLDAYGEDSPRMIAVATIR